MIVFMPFFMLDGKIFQYKVVNEELDLIALYFITWASGLIYNFYYLNKSKRLVFEYEKGYLNETAHHQDIKYLRTVIQIQFVCLIVTLLSAVLFVMRYFWGNIHDEVVENCINMAWLVFSFIGYILGYYAINQPEIFKVNEEILSDPEISSNDSLKIKGSDETLKSVELDPTLHQLKMDLLHYFNEGKPYLNNNLTINDLSDYFDVPVLSISKAINQGFNKNFFDFVNTYRVNEFKKQLRDPKNKNLTLLGIAYGVGFNSKTSFNRAFKKITSQTPSEYIQGLEL
jgi:AraC-like DNA-binding protein